MNKQIKVLIVDDSALIRSMLKKGLERFDNISIIGTANDPYEARNIINECKPDVITLDIEMPKMNGLDFLSHIMKQLPIPVIMVSSLSQRGQQITIDSLSLGAVDFVTKPQGNEPHSLSKMIHELHKKITMASSIPTRKFKQKKIVEKTFRHTSTSFKDNCLIAIGASTGGTEAIKEIIPKLPNNFPPVVITQHMPSGFTKLFAQRLNDLSQVTVQEAVNKGIIKRGFVYIAPGGMQMGVSQNSEGNLFTNLIHAEPVNGHRPSVEYLFDSLCKNKGISQTGVLLTGMGKDGSKALLSLKKTGAYTIAQDEETSVVFGMPAEAIRLGAAEAVLPIHQIAEKLIQQTKE